MNKINNIDAITKGYVTKNQNPVAKEKNESQNANKTDATISHTKPSLNAQNIESKALEVLENAKNNVTKSLEASTSNLDEARIKALLED